MEVEEAGMADVLSDSAVRNMLTRLNGALRDEGFTTSWSRPFWQWVRGESVGTEPDGKGLKRELFVADLPIPKVAPFDFTEVRVAYFLGRIRFSLTVYFREVIERAFAADEFEAIYDTHDRLWIAALDEYFTGVADRYGLKWDLEGDDMIEDSLYGDFDPAATDRILSVLMDIRSLDTREGPETRG
jgi:hypothetical protein